MITTVLLALLIVLGLAGFAVLVLGFQAARTREAREREEEQARPMLYLDRGAQPIGGFGDQLYPRKDGHP